MTSDIRVGRGGPDVIELDEAGQKWPKNVGRHYWTFPFESIHN